MYAVEVDFLFALAALVSDPSIQIRTKVHNRRIKLIQTDMSAVAEHSNNHDHISKLQDTKHFFRHNRLHGPINYGS
jgi:hypothetical protein